MSSAKLGLLLVVCAAVTQAVQHGQSRAGVRAKVHAAAKGIEDGGNIDGGLNGTPLWEPTLDQTQVTHDLGLMEDHAKMLKRAKHKKKKVTWAPFDDYRIQLTDLYPKSDPMKPEATSEAEDLSVSMVEAGLTLSARQQSNVQSGTVTVQKQFVYPRLDADATIFSGGEQDKAVNDYLKFGGFRYTLGAKDLVANRAVTPIDGTQCAKRALVFSDHFCPNIRFPASVPDEDWHPFGADKKYKGIQYQYVGAHAKNDLFDPENFPGDPRAQHFLGAFIFKKEGEEHYEWRCQDTGYGFLKQKDLHFHLGVVAHKGKVGKDMKRSAQEKVPQGLVRSVHKTLLPTAGADFLSMIQASKKMSFVYAKKDSLAECGKASHAPAHCFEAKGGFSFITSGGTEVLVSAAPASAQENTQAPLTFNSAACPSILLSEKLKDATWHEAPAEYGNDGIAYLYLGQAEAKKYHTFGTCNDHKAKNFQGAFVFRAHEAGQAPHFTWRCLDAQSAGRGPHSHQDRFRNANTGEQAMVDTSNMVDDLSHANVDTDNSAGMQEQSIDAIPNNEVLTIEEKHDFLSDLRREYPNMKISNHPV